MFFSNKLVQKMDIHDIALVKLTVAASTLFILTVWPAAMTWVSSVNTWYFLAAAVILGARPMYRIYFK